MMTPSTVMSNKYKLIWFEIGAVRWVVERVRRIDILEFVWFLDKLNDIYWATMSSTDVRYPAASGGAGSSSPPIVTPHYTSTLPSPPVDTESGRRTRCATGIRFLTTIHGLLNIFTIVSSALSWMTFDEWLFQIALACVIISAGVADRQSTIDADDSGVPTTGKVSAFHTRNAVLVFSIFGLFLVLFDTILHVTRLINRFPPVFDMIVSWSVKT